MNDVIKTILARKGTRTYSEVPVEREKLELLAKTAIAAPNAYNAQKWHFSVIRNKEVLDELSAKILKKLIEIGECKVGEVYDAFHGAPVIMVFVASKDNQFGKQDCSAACQNVAVAAKSLGLGSRYLDIPNHFFNAPEGEFDKQKIGIPDKYETICFLSIGYPEDPNEKPTEKRADVVTFID